MTSDRFEYTMHDWLAERGAGRAPDRLHADAMAVIGARRQRVGWWAKLRAGATGAPTIGSLRAGTAARIFAVLVLTLLVGVAVGFAVGNRPAVLPTPTQSPEPTTPPSTLSAPVTTAAFVEPFTYQLPIEAAPAFHLATEESDIADFGYGTTPFVGRRGVEVIALGSPWNHACPDLRVAEDATPEEFLAFLEETGASPEPAKSTVFDGRPARTTSFVAYKGSCVGQFHYDEGPTRDSKAIPITVASQFTVFEVGDATILVDIWANDDAEFDAWLPKATQFVESIHFEEPPRLTLFSSSEFVQPFEYTISTDYPQWRSDATELYAFVDSRPGLPPAGGYGPMQASAPRGIAVMDVEQLWIPVCDGGGPLRDPTSATAAEFLENLSSVHGLSLGPITSAQVDDRSALSGRTLKNSACTPDLQFEETDAYDQRLVATDMPSQFFVIDLAERTIVIDVWAQTDAQLDAWLPIAQSFLDSIHFIDQ